MAAVPQTPPASATARGKRPRLESIDGNDATASAIATPTISSAAKDKSQTKNTRNHRAALESYMMYLDEPTAQDCNPDFFHNVRQILKGDRSSEKSERSVKEIQKAQYTNRVAMENTYISNVLPLMIGKSRTVKIEEKSMTPPDTSTEGTDPNLGPSSNPDVVQQIKRVVRDFADDRLHWEGPCYFVKGMITGPRTVKLFGITDPIPDMCFGIRKQSGRVFNPPRVSDDTTNHIHAAGPLDFCFFLIEDKGPDEPFAHAETQAIRGGATLVRAMRELRRRAGYAASLGADAETFVFTCAWEHGYANIYVSWQEVLPEGEITHMHRLESYALLKDQDIKEFCRDLHNILDWGIDPQRIRDLEKMVGDISKREAAGLY
ncbi:MAG: hypothetical protein Q9220_007212 [cf. Caloplaca sp. 1 TL-2023]